ncbi:MAG: iron hydrogenase small subunit [Clostridia bacterium]|nr:iron hydrogenase small subunit [Clostridia bacterium]
MEQQNMVNLKINGIAVSVPQGTTILEAANSIGIKIPTLCYMKKINAIGACRICVVEVKGARTLVAACVYPVNEGMEVITNSERVFKARKTTLELILSDHKQDCLSCSRNQNCELQDLSFEYGCNSHNFDGVRSEYPLDESSPCLVRDNEKCILCRRCVAACQAQSIGVIGANGRGFDTHIGCAFDQKLGDVSCVGCGQCVVNCPTGALVEKDEIDNVIRALNDPTKRVVVGTAPAVRVGLGEEFGLPNGTNVEGKMVAALRRLGFDDVFDVDFAADLTIMEEGTEFLGRVQNGGVLPMITSCSPAWIKFAEHYYPEVLPHLSTCKSPQQMFGATVKTYYAEKLGMDPKDIYVVSIMPCTAKKFEKNRGEMNAAGVPDVDSVLTTRELARFIRRAGLQLHKLPDEKFDAPLGISTGAGVIFGVTGGVMEAALRTVTEVLTGDEAAPVNFTEVRGAQGIKEASYNVAGLDVKVAVASGLGNARELMEQIKNGTCEYQFIEIMSCPGGCVNGGGQPIKGGYAYNFEDVKADRTASIYGIDKSMKLRKAHNNPAVKALYQEYFGEPNSHRAHEVLHTHYEPRKKF